MDVIKWDQRQPDRSVNKFISLLAPSANVPNTLFSPRSENINLNKKTDLIEPHMVACGNQKGCCWVGSAGCQLSTRPHDCGCPAFCGRLPPLHRLQPELWAQASAVPYCAYGICACRWKSSKDRTYEATIPDVLLPARSLGFLTALGKPIHLADRNHPST